MSAQYDHASSNMSVLLKISDIGRSEEHYPKSYRNFIDPNPRGQWGLVYCACGAVGRYFRNPDVEETYLDLLKGAWRSMECSQIESPSVQVVETPSVDGAAA